MVTMHDLRRSRAVLALSLLFLVAVPGVSAPAQAQPARGATPGVPQSTRSFGIYPVTPKSANTSAVSRPARKASCTLTYYGGPVVSNIQVVPVYWSSNVNAQVRATMALFYADAVVSNWFDTLSEFATTSGTAQSIGRGTLSPATPSGVTLTPSRCAGAANCTVTDAQLQTEIAAQITAGVLPPAQFDSAGNPNTAYMVHFPANVTVIEPNGSSQSCVQFCAYHGTGTMNAKPLLYGVIMDYYTSACVGGCGAGTAINNTTAVASHQISEIATDADVGLFTGAVIAAPIAWYAPQANCGENADICNAQQATTTVGANTWTVQKLWSNKSAACIASGVQPTFATNIPASASKNAPISFALTAKNPSGLLGTDIAFVGTVHFTSNDPSATLPADFTFTPANAGVANLSATLRTVGLKSITATDTRNSAITVTANVNVTVSSNADLSTLTLSAGLLNPPFASGTLTYSSGVASVVNTITMTPTAVDAGADDQGQQRDRGKRQRVGADHAQHRQQFDDRAGHGGRRSDDQDLHDQPELPAAVIVHVCIGAARSVQSREDRERAGGLGAHACRLPGDRDVVSAVGHHRHHRAERQHDDGEPQCPGESGGGARDHAR